MKTKENIEALNIQTENLTSSTGQFPEEEYGRASKELERRIKKVNSTPEFQEFNSIKLSDGNTETLTYRETDEEDKTDDHSGRRNKRNSRMNCFMNDDEKTQAKKIKALEVFYSNKEQVESVKAILMGLFNELFAEIDIDERPEDEMQNAAESFLTKRPWDVEKHPDYRKQILYVMKYNLIPNMLNKYFGRKMKNMSDEEIQMRNFMGEGLRNKPGEKNSFRRELTQGFDINEDEGKLVNDTEEGDGFLLINRAAYDSQKEILEKERMSKGISTKLREAEKAIKKSGDNEIKMLWGYLKNQDSYSKIDVRLAEKLNKTPDEVRAIKRRLTRYLRKEVKLDINEFLKEEYEEKLAIKSR